jgi:hypothetical protein
MVSYLLNTEGGTRQQPENLYFDPNGSAGWPTYYSTSGSGNYLDQVSCVEFGGCDASSLYFYAPGGAQVQGASDRHYTIIDQSQNPMLEVDMWNARPETLPNYSTTITTSGTGYVVDVMGGTGLNEGNHGEGTAGHVGNLAGRIRIEELKDAITNHSYLHHALAISILCTNGHSVAPAGTNPGQTCASLGYSNAGNAPPMGARLWLNRSLTYINGLSVPEWKKVILRTLNKYGAIVMDTATDPVYFSLQTESDRQYTSTGGSPEWTNWAATQGTSNDFNYASSGSYPGYTGTFQNTNDSMNWTTSIWNYLEVVDPCVSSNSCN